MAKLTDCEQKMLKVVLEFAGDDEKMIREGIIKALEGVNDKARRVYLWNTLNRAAENKIRQARLRAKKMFAEQKLIAH